MKTFLQKNFVAALLLTLLGLIALSTGFAYRSRQLARQNELVSGRSMAIIQRTKDIFAATVHFMDLGIRGYALTKQLGLLSPYHTAVKFNKTNFDTLQTLLKAQRYDLAEFKVVRGKMNEYIRFAGTLVQAIEQDSMATFTRLLKEDRGYHLWKVYNTFAVKVIAREEACRAQAHQDQQRANSQNLVLQSLLFLLALPTVWLVITRLRREDRTRRQLLGELDAHNRQYLFDEGAPLDLTDARAVTSYAIRSCQQALAFVKSIGQGAYATDWPGLTDHNRAQNQDNLAGELLRLRDELRTVQQADQQRQWAAEGLASFSELVRQHQHHLADLGDHAVRFLVKYLHAQQGGLFVHQTDAQSQPFLELTACYAFDRKKHLQKRVEIGQGLVGQVFREGLPTLLTDLPPHYPVITSGLGEATPSCLVLLPVQHNGQVLAVLELASFVACQSHQLAFLERAGELLASAIRNVQGSEQTKRLLDESQLQTEQLRAQEEEMRQNMEELQATQEEMQRKQREVNAQEQAVKAMIDNVDVGIATLDSQYRLVSVNAYMKAIFERRGVYINVGEIVPDKLTPAEGAYRRKLYERALGGETFSLVEKGTVPVDGVLPAFRSTHKPLRDADGRIHALTVTAQLVPADTVA